MKLHFGTISFNKTGRFPAFTLLELLVVITIIGILSSLSLGPIKAAQIRSRDSQRKNHLNLIATALDLYYGTNRNYPGNCPNKFTSDTAIDPWIPSPGDALGNLVPSAGTVTRLPKDPKNVPPYFYTYECYVDDSRGRSYHLTATLENAKDPDRDASGQYVIDR